MAGAPDRRHFSDLDGMRGLLALVVMLYHFGLNSMLNRVVPVGQPYWDLCVDFFFVLSGFVLCRSVLASGVSPALFAWRRFGRLFPVHLVILLAFWFALYPDGVTAGGLALEASAAGPLLGTALANNPAWSMTFEFYLPIVLVAALVWGGTPGPRLSVAAILLLVPLLGWLTWLIFSGALDPLTHWLEWARAAAGLTLGFACWTWLAARRKDTVAQGDWPAWLFPLCCAAFCLVVLLGARLPVLGLSLPLVMVATLLVGTRSRSVFSTWPAQWLGRLSFGVYMVHWPVLLAAQARFGDAALQGNVALKGAMIALVLVLALALHLLVERPAMRRFRYWPGSRPIAAQA